MIRSSLMVLVVVASSCKSSPTVDGPCDPKQMEGLRGALANVNDADRAVITVVGLGEACEGKLPAGIVEGTKALASISVADRATVIAGVLEENAGFAKGGCADWEKNAKAISQVEPAKRAAMLYSSCKFERFDLLTVAEFEQSWKVSGFALLAVPMYAWLVEKNMQPAEAKKLARSMFLGEEAPKADEALPQ